MKTFPTETKSCLKACWVTERYFPLKSTSLLKCEAVSLDSLPKSPSAALFLSLTGKEFF